MQVVLSSSPSDYKPVIFNLSKEEDNIQYQSIIEANPQCGIIDYYEHQQKELFKIASPAQPLSSEQLDELYKKFILNKDTARLGSWVYYPWLNKMIHLLSREDFIALRTSRNQHKITADEQRSLSQKRIGIIGLSVGHAIAVTLAAERTAGVLKLADFDTIDLSNLNRIRTGVQNIGVNKCVVTAREIAELDPYLEVECFTEGISSDNIEQFLTEGGTLDLLLDECDSLDVKIMARIAARRHKIPVMMETSDKGMLDVERFDLEPERPLLHGKAEGINPDMLKNLSTPEKIPLVLKITDALNGSVRGRVSIIEIGQTIGTWPQLASAVALGGATVTDVARRLLLGSFNDSGRYYVDLEQLVGDREPVQAGQINFEPLVSPLRPEDLNAIADKVFIAPDGQMTTPGNDTIRLLVDAACAAPSTGNDQPWKWFYQNGILYLFHDRQRSESFGDYRNIASDLTFGGVLENLTYKAAAMNLSVHYKLFPIGEDQPLVASIHFREGSPAELFMPQLENCIYNRCTNRNATQPLPLDDEIVQKLKLAAESINGATHYYFTDQQQRLAIGQIIGQCDRVRLLNPRGHYDFVKREMRWTPQQAEQTRDGIDIRTLGLMPAQQAALMLVSDPKVVSALHKIDGGKALIQSAMYLAATASGMGIITMQGNGRTDYIAGGRSMERLWLAATHYNLAVYPLISPFYLFPRLNDSNGEEITRQDRMHLEQLKHIFFEKTAIPSNETGVFLYKIGKADEPQLRSLRLPLEEVLFMGG